MRGMIGFSNDLVHPLYAQLLSRVLRGPEPPANAGPATIAMAKSGLGIPLTPVQELILALIGQSRGACELDNSSRCSQLSDELNRLLGLGDEEQRLWLPPDAEIKRDGNDIRVGFATPITLLLCVAGRRSGKTLIASILASWLARRIIRTPTYLDDLPILPTSDVSLLNVACDVQQARILFRMLIGNLHRLGLLDRRNAPAESVRLGRLLIESLSSSSRSARGRTACGVCFDEFAHFQRTAGPLADRMVWGALKPSLQTFGPKSLAVITTSPAGRSGVVWDLFGRRGIDEGMLAVQLPTWVMNPNVPYEQLNDEFERDEILARQEYGAEFLAPHGKFLKPAFIRACVVPMDHPRPGSVRRHIHVDIGLQHDSTAIAMGYIDPEPSTDDENVRVIIETVEVLDPSGDSPLNVGEIEKRIVGPARKNEVESITFDQYQSTYLIERLQAAGFDATVIPATPKSNHEAYSTLQGLISIGKIVLPDNERLIDELTALEVTPTWYGFKVEAPSGRHDDCADAVAFCARYLLQTSSGWTDFMEVVESE